MCNVRGTGQFKTGPLYNKSLARAPSMKFPMPHLEALKSATRACQRLAHTPHKTAAALGSADGEDQTEPSPKATCRKTRRESKNPSPGNHHPGKHQSGRLPRTRYLVPGRVCLLVGLGVAVVGSPPLASSGRHHPSGIGRYACNAFESTQGRFNCLGMQALGTAGWWRGHANSPTLLPFQKNESHTMKPFGYIAQWLERLTADQQVPGSNPGVPFSQTKKWFPRMPESSLQKKSGSPRNSYAIAKLQAREKCDRQGGGIEPLHVSMPHELKSHPSTSPTHPGSLGEKALFSRLQAQMGL
jgi:hypothetical protein